MACNKRKKSVNCQNGLTLVELIVGFSIIGIISVLIASPYFSFFRLFLNQFTAIDVASENRLALNEITNQSRQSESVSVLTIPCGGDPSGSNKLCLQLWPLDQNGKPFRSSDKDYIIYKRDPQNNTKIIKITRAATSSSRKSSTKTVGTDITNLQFAYNPNNQNILITVTVTTSRVYDNKTQTTTQSADAFLRNK